jgi:hypothetical protein
MKEEVKVSFTRFFTDEGKPTCSYDATKRNGYCKFLGSRNFGTVYVCMCNGDALRRYSPTGYLQPCKDCILHPPIEVIPPDSGRHNLVDGVIKNH